MKLKTFIIAVFFLVNNVFAADNPYQGFKTPAVDFSHGSLKVSDNKRFLVHADGAPFFWLGDTAWELFHRLSKEDADIYLENRRMKGFTVIQAVVLAELDGLNTPNFYGNCPLIGNNPETPNEKYFEFVDYVVKKAEEKGLYIGLLPTWGDKIEPRLWGIGPEVFTIQNARLYGHFLGERYKNSPNIIWILGGDRPADKTAEIWRSMASGIKDGDKGTHLMTYHPLGENSSSKWFQNDDWLDSNMLQSGHARLNLENYSMIENDYGKTPVKPCLDGELRYEDHPVNWKPENGWFDDFDVRQGEYWALFAGAHGITYGCHDIWQFLSNKHMAISSARTYWKDALDLPGSFQMLYIRKLIESRPYLNRIPDQSIINGDPGSGADHIQACKGSDGGYAFIYIPTGKTVEINLNKISGKKTLAYWFNPGNGHAKKIGAYKNTGVMKFTPPSQGRGSDWVLVLDDLSKKYPTPGQKIFK